MAAVTTESLAPFGSPNARSVAMLARWADVTDEKKHLEGIVALFRADPQIGAFYDLVPIDARIAAI